MKKIIIGIHGLGNKPRFDLLRSWWRKSIHEGLNHINKPHKHFRFELVCWSDLLHPEPEDYNISDPEHPLYLSEPYQEARTWSEPESDLKRKKIQKFIEEQLEKLLLNVDGSINFSSITDKIVRRYFHDLDAYYSEEFLKNSNVLVRDAIRERLYKVLKHYQDYSILLIAHSMGSIIAFDVLMKYSSEIEIDSFMTIGSPLGFPVITSKIAKEHGGKLKIAVPDNVKKHWYNFSDLEDKVAINFDLADDYVPSQAGIGIIDYEVYNNYEINQVRNPHKAYGYLRTPQMAQKIDEFLIEGKNKWMVWFIQKWNSWLNKFK